mgnify:CR=1 FL=1
MSGQRVVHLISEYSTHEAMGRRVAKHLKGLGTIEELVLPGNNHCDEPTIAMVQTLSPVQMRAVSSAIMMLCLNLIGMGLGPLLVGLLSDLLTPYHGEDALSVALAFFTLVGLWGTVHFWLCGRALAKQQLDTA